MKTTAKYAWSLSRNSSFLRGLFYYATPCKHRIGSQDNKQTDIQDNYEYMYILKQYVMKTIVNMVLTESKSV